MAITSVGRRHHKQRDGYVLIMTLVLIAVAALSVAGIARRSLLVATESIEAEHELQRHWGATSCRRLLLEKADEIFMKLEAPHEDGRLPWPAPSKISAQVELAGTTYRLWLSDEDAKLNLNKLRERFPKQSRDIISQVVDPLTPLQLSPDLSSQARQKKRWYSSWGQVVDLSRAWQAESLEPLMNTTTSITCWGNRKLNIHRVSDELLLLVASKVVTQGIGQKLLEARTKATSLEWKELVKPLALKRKDELALKAWFDEKSTCYSLWLELDDGHRQWYHQWVLGDQGGSSQESILSFHW